MADERHCVALRLRVKREHADGCLESLAGDLDGAVIGIPDAEGLFEVWLEAGSRGDALQRVWNAIARCRADDMIVFALDPNLADHWLEDGDTT
jgi:hypothetical protein